MNEPWNRTELDTILRDALHAEMAEGRSDCLDPEDIFDFSAELSGSSDNIAIAAHLAKCANCRQTYFNILEADKLAGIHEDPRKDAFHTKPANPSFTTLRFDWKELAASSDSAAKVFQGRFLNNSLSVTMWLDQGQTILTAEHSPDSALSGQLIRYTLTAPQGNLTGFLVLPDNEAAEISLGPWEEFSYGEAEFSPAYVEDLKDSAEIAASIQRLRDMPSLGAWRGMLDQNLDSIPGAIRDTIAQELDSF